ncbi:MAG: hypothetical protein A2508_09855 [Candidatus Lambdaproteobacteria bacterium RIFOXYD12_FULL_49_8]|uniref:Uncharacterized protein n=1 Tax=Candidatus Lambdaproteobacteria bacterium RIFOXYD2_FULL_50_16 TaxID=1817772 RepID=A0A1F6GFP0_9PROT|nr:MAG: hypothetical protein A2527_00100 [Candidatus Lambdaproteobacteria bacterium RIFOXYD2_FULL_50_16]OGG97333.1 MAG: hypothetical protein A2508_09855 [Candidatus Lambdaproteobacteria bacterium RIFOXYD12_FULL_49_8]
MSVPANPPEQVKINFDHLPLAKRLEEVNGLPIPTSSDYWQLAEFLPKQIGKKIRKLFQKDLTEAEMSDLRKQAIQSPGKTQGEIQRLKKLHPDNPDLLMLSAICTYGMNQNSANNAKMFLALKLAAKDAALALVNDGLSLYNVDNFYRLYHILLERYRREAEKLEKEVRGEKYAAQRAKLATTNALLNILVSEKEKGQGILDHMKKRVMSSSYPHYFTFARISKACQSIDEQRPKEMIGHFNAQDTIAVVYAVGMSIARVPILHPLLDRFNQVMGGSTPNLELRRVSILSAQHFLQLIIAVLDEDEERVKRVGRAIFAENHAATQILDNLQIRQPYEADPFLNMALVTEMGSGAFDTEEHFRMVSLALHAQDTLQKKDMSKDGVFSNSAYAHKRKLSAMVKEEA